MAEQEVAPLEDRIGFLEEEVQRVLAEVEACSVLVLTLDASKVGSPMSGQAAAALGANKNRDTEAVWAKVEALRAAKAPEMASEQRALATLADGLFALREEVRLQSRSGGFPSASPGAPSGGGAGAQEIASLRAEMADMRRQVTQTMFIDLEERLTALHSDLSLEFAGAIAEVKQRVADLESSRARGGAPASGLHTEARAAQRGIQKALQPGASTPPRGRRDLSPGPGVARKPKPGAPVIVGRRVEWQLSAEQVEAAVAGAAQLGPLVSRELEMSGVKFRLKFFPAGSPLRQQEGYCSMYLLTLVPVELKFRLFAGDTESPMLEATSRAAAKDIGRHDLAALSEVLGAEGGVMVGAEFLDIVPVKEEEKPAETSKPPFRPGAYAQRAA